jgi:hypothetical protein
MANLIDLTYFNTDKTVSRPETDTLLTAYILKFEPEILEKILGYDLKKAFLAGLTGTVAQKWTDLKEGKEYSKDGIYYNWPGFTNTLKQSLIANYVFYKFTCGAFYTTNGSGIWLASSENSKQADKRYLQVMIYNEMIDLINKMDCFISYQNSVDSATYPNYSPETLSKINIFNI